MSGFVAWLAVLDWTAVSSQFTAVVVASVALFRAIRKLVEMFRPKDGV